MTVYVDAVQNYGDKGNWSHLWADGEAELHVFAVQIGLKREWCHVSVGKIGRWAHYDLASTCGVECGVGSDWEVQT